MRATLGAVLRFAGDGRGAIVRKAKNIIGTGMVETGKLDQHLGADPACRSRNWSSRPVCISDTPQHPFAADHDPPADPGYVDTWYLPQRLYLR